LDITRSILYQVRAQADKVKSIFIQPEMDHIADNYDLHRFESDAECLKFNESLLVDKKYIVPVAEHVEHGVRGPNPTQSVPKAANEWLASTLIPGGSNPRGLSASNFIIGRITAVSMLMVLIIP
jgi:hypothetical protein